jgi:ubiquinone/menaquinone biosynthesis C-methylase UbiE
MTTNNHSGPDQSKIWNEAVGDAWVEHAAHFDATLEPFGEAVMQRLTLRPGDRVVDIGCGTGATTIRLADTVQPGLVTGVDLSLPMLHLAQQRVAALGISNVTFSAADVQTDPLEAGVFDVAYSRFGVMFFSDPAVAFTNIGKSLRPGGQLGFVCFQTPAENPFIVVPIMAAAAHLRLQPPANPDEPSPFALANHDRTSSILRKAGFSDVTIESGPTEAVLGQTNDLRALAQRLLEQNPSVAPALAAASPTEREGAIEASAHALAPYLIDGEVKLRAGTWIVTARAHS